MARLSGKRALMEQLVADGVHYIFGNPGTTEQAFMDLLQEYPQLEFILCLHEGVAVSMADTFARATRRPAFCELHIGPGAGQRRAACCSTPTPAARRWWCTWARATAGRCSRSRTCPATWSGWRAR